jgi:hypothetical protein
MRRLFLFIHTVFFDGLLFTVDNAGRPVQCSVKEIAMPKEKYDTLFPLNTNTGQPPISMGRLIAVTILILFLLAAGIDAIS